MSAAGATATALAVGALAGRTHAESIEIAHLADLFGGGGLGGVAAIEGGGGIEFRTRPGLPPWGRTIHRPLSGSVFVGLTGAPLPSPDLLRDRQFLERVEAASDALDELLRRPSERRFFSESERFTDRLRIAPPALERVVRGLRRRGAWAAQAMFGRSFFARPKTASSRAEVVAWLERTGIPTVELAPAKRGARLLRSPPKGSVP